MEIKRKIGEQLGRGWANKNMANIKTENNPPSRTHWLLA